MCGVQDEIIFADYQRTELYTKTLFRSSKNKTIASFANISMQRAPAEVMRELFVYIRHKHGSVVHYIDVVVGLGCDRRKELVEKIGISLLTTEQATESKEEEKVVQRPCL